MPDRPATLQRRTSSGTTDPRKAKYNTDKLIKRLRRLVGQAVMDFGMIDEGDRIMVCLSGGKDSYAMLDMLTSLQRSAPVSFELIAVNLDQKHPGFPEHVLPTYLDGLGIEWHVIEKNTYGVVQRLIPEGKTACGLCSRLRRGTLYEFARKYRLNKIALGHHLDDVVETFFLNLFHGGTMKAMPPKLLNDEGDLVVIRPLIYCREKDLERLGTAREYPIIPCNLCGSQPNLERQNIKVMLAEWERQHPGRTMSIFRALTQVTPSHLCDPELFDIINLSPSNL